MYIKIKTNVHRACEIEKFEFDFLIWAKDLDDVKTILKESTYIIEGITGINPTNIEVRDEVKVYDDDSEDFYTFMIWEAWEEEVIDDEFITTYKNGEPIKMTLDFIYRLKQL